MLHETLVSNQDQDKMNNQSTNITYRWQENLQLQQPSLPKSNSTISQGFFELDQDFYNLVPEQLGLIRHWQALREPIQWKILEEMCSTMENTKSHEVYLNLFSKSNHTFILFLYLLLFYTNQPRQYALWKGKKEH